MLKEIRNVHEAYMEIQLRQQQNDIFIVKLHIDLIYHKIYEWQTMLQVYVNKDINYTNVNTCLMGNQCIPMSVFLPSIFHLPATNHRSEIEFSRNTQVWQCWHFCNALTLKIRLKYFSLALILI